MKLVKEKKHKEFKNTVLGKIPKDWRCVSFQDVLQGFTSGATPYRGIPEYYTGDIKWITSSELNYDIIYDTKEKITEEAVRKTNLRIHPSGTFLMAITGLEAEGTRGRCGIVGSEATTNQSCMALYPIEGEILAEYLFYFYQNYGDELAFKFCQGTKQQSYTASVVKILPITLPPTLEEQRAIAEALSDVDALIAELDALIKKKQQVKKGAMQQLLTGKKRLPGFDGKWEEKRLGDLLSESPEYGINASATSYTEKYPKYLRITDISEDGRFIKDDLKSVNHPDVHKYYLKEGDIVLARTGASTGKSYLYNPDDGKLVFAGFLIRIMPDPNKLEPKFLKYYLQTDKYWDWVSKMSMRSGQPGINSKEYSNLTIPFPCTLNEQKAISQILSDMDAEIQVLQDKRSKYEKIKQGMMQELLTGKTRLV